MDLYREMQTRDPELATHSKTVAALSIRLAQELQLSPDELETVRLAALLHDVGKLSLPYELLNKPGRLTSEERDLLQTHSVLGEELVRARGYPAEVAQAVRHHHEKWDGTGFPDRLAGDRIPLPAQIVGLSDFFVALTAVRPYRKPLPLSTVLTELEGWADRFFDRALVSRFVRLGGLLD